MGCVGISTIKPQHPTLGGLFKTRARTAVSPVVRTLGIVILCVAESVSNAHDNARAGYRRIIHDSCTEHGLERERTMREIQATYGIVNNVSRKRWVKPAQRDETISDPPHSRCSGVSLTKVKRSVLLVLWTLRFCFRCRLFHFEQCFPSKNDDRESTKIHGAYAPRPLCSDSYLFPMLFVGVS